MISSQRWLPSASSHNLSNTARRSASPSFGSSLIISEALTAQVYSTRVCLSALTVAFGNGAAGTRATLLCRGYGVPGIDGQTAWAGAHESKRGKRPSFNPRAMTMFFWLGGVNGVTGVTSLPSFLLRDPSQIGRAHV